MSSDDESPTLIFSRSVRTSRTCRRFAPESPSEAENIPPECHGIHSKPATGLQKLFNSSTTGAGGGSFAPLQQSQQQAGSCRSTADLSARKQTTQVRELQQTHIQQSISMIIESNGSTTANAPGAAVSTAFGLAEESPAAAAATGGSSLSSSTGQVGMIPQFMMAVSSSYEPAAVMPAPEVASPAASAAAPAAAAAAAEIGSPATPAAAKLPNLDIDDPYTPWLRTINKPHLCRSQEQQAGPVVLLGSPLSTESSDDGDSNSDSSGGHHSRNSSLSEQSARVAFSSTWRGPQEDQQHHQHQQWRQQQQRESGGGTALTVVTETASVAADIAYPPFNMQCSNTSSSGDGSSSSSGDGSSSSSSSSDDEEEEEQQLLTFARRRVFTRGRTAPWQQHGPKNRATDSSDGSSEAESDTDTTINGSEISNMQAAARAAAVTPAVGGSSSSRATKSSDVSAQDGSGVHSAGRSGCSGRITPGSSSSLVARRRRRQQQQQRRQLWSASQPSSTPQQNQEQQHCAAADEYNIEALLSAPRTGRLVIRGVPSPEPDAMTPGPAALLSFTPAAKLQSSSQEQHEPQPLLQQHQQQQQQQQQQWEGQSGTPGSAPQWGGQSTTDAEVTPLVAGTGGPGRNTLEVPDSCFGYSGMFDSSPAPFEFNNWDTAAGFQGSVWQQPAGLRTTVTPADSNSSLPGKRRPAAATGAGKGGRRGDRAAAHGIDGPAAAAAGARTAPPKALSSRTFARQRQQLSQQLYAQWNSHVFDGGLPADLPLIWNPRLTSTAGQVIDDGSANHTKASSEERVPVRLELSTKVLDCEARLRTTLAHEMCHVAAWAISREFKQHHGAAFWGWARRFERRVPGISITTCHNYEVHAPFRWQCCNTECGKQYHRHKRSIDPNRHCCSRCNGRLTYLGKFSRDGRLLAAATPAAGASAAAAGGARGGNVFSQYVKQHFADIKRSLPAGTPHKEIMSHLATGYKQQKAGLQQQQLLISSNNSGPAVAVGVAAGSSSSSSSSDKNEDANIADEAEDYSSSLLMSFMDRLTLAD